MALLTPVVPEGCRLGIRQPLTTEPGLCGLHGAPDARKTDIQMFTIISRGGERQGLSGPEIHALDGGGGSCRLAQGQAVTGAGQDLEGDIQQDAEGAQRPTINRDTS